MRSIKPGRAPSAMSAGMCVVVVIFGIFWTIGAAQMGAPIFMPLFGIVFVIMGIVQGMYHYKNATNKNRFSSFDITEEGEEIDPFGERFHSNEAKAVQAQSSEFCPYCGESTKSDYSFCRKCGKGIK